MVMFMTKSKHVSTSSVDHGFLPLEETSILLELFGILDTPKSLAAYICLKNKEISELFRLSVNPNDYCLCLDSLAIDKLQRDQQVVALFKKNPDIGSICDKKQVAITKFFAAEQKCKETNDYLRTKAYVGKTNLAGYLYSAKNFIRNLLGTSPRISTFSFGPGASSACKGFNTTIVDKLSKKPECTLGARTIIAEILDKHMFHYSLSCDVRNNAGSLDNDKIPIVLGNSFTTVPKDERGDRGICIEPHGNIIAQKGLGAYFKKRLSMKGWDLTKLPDLHGRYACQGSVDNSLATIDLSSASDTICFQLVKELLPPDWFALANRLRSPKTLIENEWIDCEKFSSMGNGFTFELETVIFLSLCHAVSSLHGCKDDTISVFGDDIVIDSYLAPLLISLLEETGFDVNEEKSFSTGHFRESCGNDYFHGQPVRPVFLKEKPFHEVEKRYVFANRVREIAYRFGLFGYCDRRFRSLWRRIVESIPLRHRHFGPASFSRSRKFYVTEVGSYGQLSEDSLGDQVLVSNRPSKLPCNRYQYSVSYLRRISRNQKKPQGCLLELACALYGVPSSGISPRHAKYHLIKRSLKLSFWSVSELAWQ